MEDKKYTQKEEKEEKETTRTSSFPISKNRNQTNSFKGSWHRNPKTSKYYFIDLDFFKLVLKNFGIPSEKITQTTTAKHAIPEGMYNYIDGPEFGTRKMPKTKVITRISTGVWIRNEELHK